MYFLLLELFGLGEILINVQVMMFMHVYLKYGTEHSLQI